ncbi:MAG: hypothetical protein U1E27_03055, partial [Kiritimatiellia bacterium]|nr:hypothetical protein [Kiritimatiellia bacterium]
GFADPVHVELADPPKGIEQVGKTQISGTQTVARITLKSTLPPFENPISLKIIGWSTNAVEKIVRPAVPAEDRMQAFLWRHLVPAEDFQAIVR